MKIRSTYIFLFVSLLLIGLAFYLFANIMAYVLIAFILSMVGQPIMRFFLHKLKFERIKPGSSIAAVLTILIFILFFVLVLRLFVPPVVMQAQNLVGVDYAQIGEALEEPIGQLQSYMTKFGLDQEGRSPEVLVKETLKDWYNPNRIGDFFGSLLGLASEFILAVFSVAFVMFFFLQEKGLLLNFILALVPDKYEASVKQALENIIKLLRRYFGGIFLQVTIITIFVSLALTILGIKNALLIGFFAALINVIPYLGPLIGAAFGIFIAISSNLDLDFYSQMLPILIKLVLVFATVQMLDNFILQPYIFSNRVLAHPLEIFIVILVAARISGIPGMILAIPVYTMIRVIARTFLNEFKIVQKLTGSLGNKTGD